MFENKITWTDDFADDRPSLASFWWSLSWSFSFCDIMDSWVTFNIIKNILFYLLINDLLLNIKFENKRKTWVPHIWHLYHWTMLVSPNMFLMTLTFTFFVSNYLFVQLIQHESFSQVVSITLSRTHSIIRKIHGSIMYSPHIIRLLVLEYYEKIIKAFHTF